MRKNGDSPKAEPGTTAARSPPMRASSRSRTSAAWPASPLIGVSVVRNRLLDPDGDGIVLWGVDGGVIEHNTEEGGGAEACLRAQQALIKALAT